MSGVFRNIDPPPHHRPTSVYPPPLVRGEDRRGGGSIVRKTQDTALYSIYVSTLWSTLYTFSLEVGTNKLCLKLFAGALYIALQKTLP